MSRDACSKLWHNLDLASFLLLSLHGLRLGLCYIIPMILGWEFYPTKKGFVSGLIMCGFGFAAFVYGFVAQAIVNPEGDHPDENLPTIGGDVYASDSP